MNTKHILLFLCLVSLACAAPLKKFNHQGTSMIPLIPPGSVLYVDTSEDAWNRIQPNSIIVFRNIRGKTGNTAHLAVSQPFPGYWCTRGTNLITNLRPDRSLVSRALFVGIVICVHKPKSN